MKLLQVAVGVVRNTDGQVLISLRDESLHQGGLWEFPGGKIESGESADEALARELKEELAITVIAATPTYRTWNADMQLTEVNDANGRITKYIYDSSGNLMTVTDPLNNSVQFIYHPLFNHLSSITDALGRTTSYFYDANGNLTQKTDAIGNITSYEYNAAGQPIKTIDEAGREIFLSYDNIGNLLTITDNQGNITGFEYDDAGRRTKLIDALGNATTYEYDALDRLIKQLGPSGEVSTFVFDETGNLIQLTNPNGNTVTYGYDIYDHLISVKDVLGNITRFEYDLNENMTATTDALGRRTIMSYDKANQLIRITRPDGVSIDLGYDPVGNNTSIKDPSGNLTQFIYDAVNRPARTNYPDGSFETRTYDAVGNLLGFKDRSGKEIAYQYDGVDRIKVKSYPNTGNIIVEYNELGFIRSVSNPVGTIGYVYDTLDRISQVSDVYGRSVNYSYDAVGRRVSMTDSLGGSLSYKYDPSSRLVNLGTTAGQVNFSYDSGGRLIQKQLPNGIKSQFVYDAADRLTLIEHRNADDSIIDYFSYQYDAVGNKIQASTADGESVEYEYDILNRLIRETGKNGNGDVLSNTQYEYDANGNRVSLNQDGIQTDFSYNSFNQLISGGNAAYIYDGNGNLQNVIEGAGETTYSYNDQNFLTGVIFPDGDNIAFEYDGVNRRVLKTDASGATRYLFDNTILISESDDLDTIRTRYHAANGIVSQTGLSGLLYYLTDGQGSTRYLLNSTGNIVSEYSYDAFGNLVTQTGSYNPFTFSANYGYYRSSADLFHIGARHYRPDLGRFLQIDPLYQGSNWYVYALNDPVNLVDPTGEWVHIAIGGGIGAAANTGVYLISTPREQWSWGGGVQAAATGAVVGAVGAATFGASMPATLGGAIIRGGAAGLTTTLSGDLTNSAFNQKLQFSNPYTYATNMAIGGAIAGGTYGVGKAIQNYRSMHASKRGIKTPYGIAKQSNNPAALAARTQIEEGATLYRVGTTGKSQAAEAQFWALEHPNTSGFAQRYGIPAENVQNANFIEAATVKPGTSFVTRSAPGVGSNMGGGVEVVVPEGGVQMKWFSAP